MIFWDTSAVVPLIVAEEASQSARRLLRREPAMVVWWGTAVECLSALARLERDGSFSHDSAEQGRQLLQQLQHTWNEVLPTEEVRGHASRLLLRQPVRAADALQLAAALTWARGRPSGHRFFTFDDRLAAAARREGFAVVEA